MGDEQQLHATAIAIYAGREQRRPAVAVWLVDSGLAETTVSKMKAAFRRQPRHPSPLCSLLGAQVWRAAYMMGGRVPCMARLWQQRLQLKLFSLIQLRKQCRLLVPFLFGEANPNPNLIPEAHLASDRHGEPSAPRRARG